MAEQLGNVLTMRRVPFQEHDGKATTIYDYSPRGMRNLYPVKVLDAISTSYNGMMKLLIDLMPTFDLLIRKGQYPFLRLDINMLFLFLRVRATEDQFRLTFHL
jgi:hypothetical protein